MSYPYGKLGMRRRWSVGPDCKSGALRGLAGSNPAIPTEEGRLKNKEQGFEKFELSQITPSPLSIPCSLFLLLFACHPDPSGGTSIN